MLIYIDESDLLENEDCDTCDGINIGIAPEDRIKWCRALGGDVFAFSLTERLDAIDEEVSKLRVEKTLIESIREDYLRYKKEEQNEK